MKYIIVIIVILILIVLAFAIFSGNNNGQNNSEASPTSTTSDQNASSSSPVNTETAEPSTVYTPSATASPPLAIKPTPIPRLNITIDYSDNGFEPKSVTIRKGGTITFVNASSHDLWPASDPHPAHNEYLEEGCSQTSFDSCTALGPGESWSFTFNLSGTWSYHNHRLPNKTGAIIVQ